MEALLADLNKKHMQSQMRIHELETEVERVHSAKNALMKENDKDKNKWKEVIASLEVKIAAAAGLESLIAETQQLHCELRKVTEHRDTLQEDLQRINEKLATAEKQVEGLLQTNASLQDTISSRCRESDIESRLRKQIKDLEEKELVGMTEQERLKRLLAEAHADTLKLKTERNKAESEALEAEEQQQVLEKRIQSLVSQMDGLKADAEEATSEKNTLEEECVKLRAQVRSLDQSQSKDDVSADRKKIRDAIAKLTKAQESMEGVLTCMAVWRSSRLP